MSDMLKSSVYMIIIFYEAFVVPLLHRTSFFYKIRFLNDFSKN